MNKVKLVHWFNSGFTIATLSFDIDAMLKVAAFLFVTLPLGYVQWTQAAERWRERRKNGRTKS